MGSSQSRIQGTTIGPSESTIIKSLVKSSLSSVNISAKTLNQILNPIDSSAIAAKPNRFTLKAILKNSSDLSSNTSFDPSQCSSRLSIQPQIDELEPNSLDVLRWFFPTTNSDSLSHSLRSHASSGSGSLIQTPLDGRRPTRMSAISLSTRRNFVQRFNHPPIYQTVGGEYYVAFDACKFVFSNGYICPNSIHVDGHCFATSEHCYLYYKALFHGNAKIANQVLIEGDVCKVQKLVEPIDSMNHDKWRRVQIDIMRRICMAKFEQNALLRTELFRTGNATLVAAIADCHWGVGLPIDDPNVSDVTRWRGSNLLGQLLMAVRSLLAVQYTDEFQNEQSVVEERQQRCVKLDE